MIEIFQIANGGSALLINISAVEDVRRLRELRTTQWTQGGHSRFAMVARLRNLVYRFGRYAPSELGSYKWLSHSEIRWA